jgi:signal transduction histidine kinase
MTQSPLEPFPLVTTQEDAQGTPRGRGNECEELAPSKGDPGAGAAVLGLRELCHDLQQELSVMECLVGRLIGVREPRALESALGAQLRVLNATLREARMPSAPRRLPLRPLVTDTLQTVRLVYPGVIDLNASTEGVVEGIATDVRRALVNLIDNARRAAPSGVITVTLADEDDDVVLEVADDGSGGQVARGSALGMTVVHDVARRHSGQVTRRAGASGGRAVALRLPRLGV